MKKRPSKRIQTSPLAIHGGRPIRTKPFPAYRVIGPDEQRAAQRVLRSGILSRYLGCWDPDFYGGPEVRAFEKEWAKYFNVTHAIAVNSNSSGIQCALGAIGIEHGDEVIASPYSMSISATAPLFYGGIPVFADIEPEYLCLDPKSVESKITARTKAIIVVDLFGQPYDRTALNALAKKHNLVVIEDAAQAPGARYGKDYAGTLGDIGVFSLNYHKHIHTGEGGVVVTNDDRIAERIRLIRNHAESVVGGKGEQDLVNMVGYNMRLTELQAAIGRSLLRKLRPLVAARQKQCAYLAKRIGKLKGVRPAPTRAGATHAYYMQPFFFDEDVVGVSRKIFLDAVIAELPVSRLREQEGVLINYPYVTPLYQLPIFQKKIAFGRHGYPWKTPGYESTVQYAPGMCPVVELLDQKYIFTHQLMHACLTQKDVEDVARAFEKVYQHVHLLQT